MRKQYKICLLCNAHLDLGEKCDCEEERERKQRYLENIIQEDRNSKQYVLNFKSKVGL